MHHRNENRFKGRVVVVTGASAGVGRAVVREFAREGAALGLLARGEGGLEAARREVEAAGSRALAVSTDVADADAVEAAAAQIEAELGPIDVWVNDAMTTIFAPVSEIRPEEYRRATEVTYLGTVWGTMAALRRMRPRDRGTIVQVGSALAYRAIPLQAPYCGAKHAVRAFTAALRSELIHDGSRVHLTMVQLPGLNTPQFSWCASRMPRQPRPVAPVFQPEVAARAIVWAAGHRRREVYVGWPTVKTILGQKLAAGYLDRYLARHVVEGQETSQPTRPGRPSNLFAPVPGDHGAHGVFDEEAHAHSLQSWASLHRGLLAGIAGLGGAAALVALLVRHAG